MAAEEDLRRFKFKWTLPRMVVQLISLLAVNAIAFTAVYPYLSLKAIPFGLPILNSVNSPYSSVYGTLDLFQLELAQPEFPWIALGTVFLIGAVIGRAFCGWVCPIGFIQDIITNLKGKLDMVSPDSQPIEEVQVLRTLHDGADKRHSRPSALLGIRNRLQGRTGSFCYWPVHSAFA